MTAPTISTSTPTDVAATDTPTVAPSGMPAGGHPGHLLPLPKQGRGGDVRNAPHPPLRAVEHLTNVHHPVITPAPDGGEAA